MQHVNNDSIAENEDGAGSTSLLIATCSSCGRRVDLNRFARGNSRSWAGTGFQSTSLKRPRSPSPARSTSSPSPQRVRVSYEISDKYQKVFSIGQPMQAALVSQCDGLVDIFGRPTVIAVTNQMTDDFTEIDNPILSPSRSISFDEERLVQ